MELHLSLRLEEFLWPIIFVDICMLDLVNWPRHLRVQNILHVENIFKKFESDLSSNELCTESFNRNYECAKDKNEYVESLDNDNLSFKCEEKDSNVSESNDSSQHEEDGYTTNNESCDSVYKVEELYNSSRGNSYHDENECNEAYSFLWFTTNVFAIISSSCHVDNNHNQEVKTCEEFFVSPYEISAWLAHDFKKIVFQTW